MQRPAQFSISLRYSHGLEIIEASKGKTEPKCYKITVSDFYHFDVCDQNLAEQHLPWGKIQLGSAK